MGVLARLNVSALGRQDGQPLLFAHGFGCDQNMWRFVIPAFTDDYRVILYDQMGMGQSDSSAYDPERYSTLDGYADDVLQICEELDLRDVIFVGHSVSAMIGVVAERREPDRFAAMVMVGPSPRYLDDDESGYRGGFSQADIEQLLASLGSNYLGWSSEMAPVIMGNPERPELGQELTASFCRADPDIARRFAEVTFLSDSRADLPEVSTPTLVLQCSNDVIAPVSVGEFVRDAVPDSTFRMLEATGHCPNLSAPEQTVRAIKDFLRSRKPRTPARL